MELQFKYLAAFIGSMLGSTIWTLLLSMVIYKIIKKILYVEKTSTINTKLKYAATSSLFSAVILTYIMSYTFAEKQLVNKASKFDIISMCALLSSMVPCYFLMKWYIKRREKSVIDNKTNHSQIINQCPYCKEEIKSDALICKHCKSDLKDPSQDGA